LPFEAIGESEKSVDEDSVGRAKSAARMTAPLVKRRGISNHEPAQLKSPPIDGKTDGELVALIVACFSRRQSGAEVAPADR
jgi:hypothetical protein